LLIPAVQLLSTPATDARFVRNCSLRHLSQGERTPLKTDDCVDPRGSAFCVTCVGTIGTAASSCGVNGEACLSTPAEIAHYGVTDAIVCACKDNLHTIGKCHDVCDDNPCAVEVGGAHGACTPCDVTDNVHLCASGGFKCKVASFEHIPITWTSLVLIIVAISVVFMLKVAEIKWPQLLDTLTVVSVLTWSCSVWLVSVFEAYIIGTMVNVHTSIPWSKWVPMFVMANIGSVAKYVIDNSKVAMKSKGTAICALCWLSTISIARLEGFDWSGIAIVLGCIGVSLCWDLAKCVCGKKTDAPGEEQLLGEHSARAVDSIDGMLDTLANRAVEHIDNRAENENEMAYTSGHAAALATSVTLSLPIPPGAPAGATLACVYEGVTYHVQVPVGAANTVTFEVPSAPLV